VRIIYSIRIFVERVVVIGVVAINVVGMAVVMVMREMLADVLHDLRVEGDIVVVWQRVQGVIRIMMVMELHICDGGADGVVVVVVEGVHVRVRVSVSVLGGRRKGLFVEVGVSVLLVVVVRAVLQRRGWSDVVGVGVVAAVVRRRHRARDADQPPRGADASLALR